MEGDLITSPRLADTLDEGNISLSIQADSENLTIPILADTRISTRADEVNQVDDGISRPADEDRANIASQADADNLSFSVRSDEGTHNISVREDSSNPSIPSVCVSVHAHLEASLNSGAGSSILISARADLAQETNSLENSQEKEAARARNSLLNLEDVAMEDGVEEAEPLDNLPEETPVAVGKLENGASALEKSSHAAQVYDHDHSGEEFLPIENVDDSVACDKDTGLVDGETCKEEESNFEDSAPMQELAPWNEGSIDDLATAPDLQDSDRRSSLKRSRSSNYDDTPCVQVIYRCLTSESKNKLKDFMQQWAQWHGEFVRIEATENGPLESGDETYFPPLQVGRHSRATMSFWMDKPSKQARTENAVGESTPISQAREKEVPLYDRAGTGALLSHETGMSLDGDLGYADEGSRCFNCGSYSHSMKECPRPRDNTAINNARKLLAEKRGSANGSRTASRYYQSSPGGKFDDLKPGFLGTETRQLLGIGERDPPPWLHRMRELGYPPGYLEEQEEEQSGITIFGTSEDAEGSFIGEEGEILGESKRRSSSSAKKMVVHFPGVNAPIPDDADQRSWGSFADRNSHERAPHRIGGRSPHPSSFSAAAVTSDGTVYTGTESWEGPPGASSRDSYLRSCGLPSPGFEGSSMYSSSSAWQPNEQGRLGKAPPGRSPYLGRSSSDSGRRSPRKVACDEPHSLPPLGGLHSSSRHSPLRSSRSHMSPSATPSQRYPYVQQQGREEDSRRRAWSHAQDALQSMHRSDRHHSPGRRR